ncbi:SAM-dependent methyltransferase [Gorillibacterium timonense]|uniref:SAM-dependent methyltransferase n=1 Tax=Gorillibacterium timonense TaxID=1689269 RepID=UPI00071D7670|nr:class I SAM-dependent methyltransferase [Gorillibacterium timonense]
MAEAWYEKSFGQDYLLVYKHRDMMGAQAEASRMTGWLHLDPGSHVFDLCCGMGRHSLALAEEGYRVTGMDLSDVLLEEARRLDVRHQVEWVKGDMRAVPLEGPFDAVVNLFTSFGYFETDAENGAVLREIGRLLRPGGRFLLDFMNARYVERNLVPYSERQDGAVTIRESRSIESGFVFKRIVLSEPGKPERNYLERVRLYGKDDFERLLAGTGLILDQVHGDYESGAYSEEDSKRLILVGTREDK